jgi:hypothetical protein
MFGVALLCTMSFFPTRRHLLTGCTITFTPVFSGIPELIAPYGGRDGGALKGKWSEAFQPSLHFTASTLFRRLRALRLSLGLILVRILMRLLVLLLLLYVLLLLFVFLRHLLCLLLVPLLDLLHPRVVRRLLF